MRVRPLLLASLASLLGACDDAPPPPPTWPAGSVVVHASGADPALADAVDDLVRDLGRVYGVTAQRATGADPAACVPGRRPGRIREGPRGGLLRIRDVL